MITVKELTSISIMTILNRVGLTLDIVSIAAGLFELNRIYKLQAIIVRPHIAIRKSVRI